MKSQSPTNLRLFSLLLSAGLVLFVLFTVIRMELDGEFNWYAATFRCGHKPVIATDFAASYVYYLPSQDGYHPALFSEYYCSETDAQRAGFQRSPF